ncbi:MAG: hypothetical protein AAF400_00385 [Bacteroidota bacterium]
MEPRVLERFDPKYIDALARGDLAEAERIKQGWVPILGSGVAAYEALEEDKTGQAAFHAAMAAGEAVGIGLIAKGAKGAKLAWKGGKVATARKGKAVVSVVQGEQAAGKVVGGVAKEGAIRTLSDPSTLRGAKMSEVSKLIPKGWKKMPLKKGRGVRYVNPEKPGASILIERGWENTTDLAHSGPYVRIARDGKITRIPLSGNPAL